MLQPQKFSTANDLHHTVHKGIFSGIHGMPLMRMYRKIMTLCHTTGVIYMIFATRTKLLDIKSEVYRSGGDLIETNN